MGFLRRSWLPKWLTPNRAARRKSRIPSCRPQVWHLEDRTVPSTTFTVTNTNDSGPGSLREAINSANTTLGADTIGFSNSTANGATNFYDGNPHTIILSSALPITDSVSITGAGSSKTIIDARDPTTLISAGRLFTIDDTSATSALSVTLQGLTMQNGFVSGPFAQGGGILFSGLAKSGNSLTIQDCIVAKNTALGGDAAGGGVAFQGGAAGDDTLSIQDSFITGNAATAGTGADRVGGKAYGGGVWVTGAIVTLSNSTLSGNLAQGGKSFAASSDLLHAAAYGGGLYASKVIVTVTDDSFMTDNTAHGGDGSTEQEGPGSVGGRAYGGGMYVTDAGANVTNSSLLNNEARAGDTKASPWNAKDVSAFGGGLAAEGTTVLIVSDSMISTNKAQGGLLHVTDDPRAAPLSSGSAFGGGLFADIRRNGVETEHLLFRMDRSEVDSNNAFGGALDDDLNDQLNAVGGAGVGGGMDVVTRDQFGTITAQGQASNSTFASNTARGGSVTISNIDIQGITEGHAVGGVAFTGGVAVSRLINSTVYDNTAQGGNAGLYRTNGTILLFAPAPAAGPGLAGGGGFGPGNGLSDLTDINRYGFAYYSFGALPAGVTYTIANSTIDNNHAVAGIAYPGRPEETQVFLSFGGGVDDGAPVVQQDARGKYITNFGNVRLYSTIVAKNDAAWQDQSASPNVQAGPDIVGGSSDSHNLIGVSDASAPNFPQSPFTGGVLVPNTNGDLVGPGFANPQNPAGLGDFNFHGGPTKTLVPQAGSLAIDNGQNAGVPNVFVPPTYDQRGVPFVRTQPLTGGAAVNYADGTDVGATEVQTVLSVVVNHGDVQRSRVTDIEVTFSIQVTLAPGAFILTRVGLPDNQPGDNATLTSDPNGGISVATALVNGQTVATLTFSGPFTDSLSLQDGNWTLRIDHTKVTAATGDGMAADFTQPDITRLFGDSDGDRDVDAVDQFALAGTYGKKRGDAGYLDYFDYNQDGFVDALDLFQYAGRNGHTV